MDKVDMLAEEGHVVHIYDFRVKPGTGDEFIRLFNEFDYSPDNPMHRATERVKDGVLCRDAVDPDRFYLLGEWTSIEAHRAILQQISKLAPPKFFELLAEGSTMVPNYATVVSEAPR